MFALEVVSALLGDTVAGQFLVVVLCLMFAYHCYTCGFNPELEQPDVSSRASMSECEQHRLRQWKRRMLAQSSARIVVVKRTPGRRCRVGLLRRVRVDVVDVYGKEGARVNVPTNHADDFADSTDPQWHRGFLNIEDRPPHCPVTNHISVNRHVMEWLDSIGPFASGPCDIRPSDCVLRWAPEQAHRSHVFKVERLSSNVHRPTYTAADMAEATVVKCGGRQCCCVSDLGEPDMTEPFPELES